MHEWLEGLGELRLDVLVLIQDLQVLEGLSQISHPVGVVDRVYKLILLTGNILTVKEGGKALLC